MVLGPIDDWEMQTRKRVGYSLFVVGALVVWSVNVPSVAIGSATYQGLLTVGGALMLAGMAIVVLRPGRVYGSTEDALGKGGH